MMTPAKPWHEDDSFWEITMDWIFGESRLKAAPGEVDNILAMLDIPAQSSILDLCCGPGRHSLELARRGYDITGVDRTKKYLDKAKEIAATDKIKVNFILDDMRIYKKPDSYDAIINLFTAFGYFENQDEERLVIENVYKSLKKGGKFIIDLMGKEVLARIFIPRDWSQKENVFFLEERKPSDGWNFMDNRWILIENGKKMEFEFKLRLYSANELSALLKEVGFDKISTYGGLDGSAYDQTAQRLVIMAQK